MSGFENINQANLNEESHPEKKITPKSEDDFAWNVSDPKGIDNKVNEINKFLGNPEKKNKERLKEPQIKLQNPEAFHENEEKQKLGEAQINLQEVKEYQNLGEAQKILQEPETLRGMIMQRGKENKNLDTLILAMNKFIEEKYGPGRDLMNIESRDLVLLVRELKLPQQILVNLVESAYHINNELLFFKLLKDIAQQRHNVHPRVYFLAQHDLATWEGSKRKNAEAQIEKNKEILKEMKEAGESDDSTALKLKFGITYAKSGLSYRVKGDEFWYLSKALEKDNKPDSIRALIEAAEMYLALSQRQDRILRMQNLNKAKTMAKQAMGDAIEINYRVAEIKARKTLSKIYLAMGDEKKSKSYEKGSDALAKLYDYTIQE